MHLTKCLYPSNSLRLAVLQEEILKFEQRITNKYSVTTVTTMQIRPDHQVNKQTFAICKLEQEHRHDQQVSKKTLKQNNCLSN